MSVNDISFSPLIIVTDIRIVELPSVWGRYDTRTVLISAKLTMLFFIHLAWAFCYFQLSFALPALKSGHFTRMPVS